jgi:lysophospholipase L1-like esterase
MKRTLELLKKSEQVTIVALGDSNTEVTFHTQGHMNWVGLLAEGIFETYGAGVCTLINAGKCASTTGDALERLERDVLRFTPDLVILALGMNDAARGGVGLEGFETRMRSLIEAIRAGGCEILIRTPNPVVTVHGLPLPPEQDRPGRASESEARPLARYVAVLNRLGEELDIPVVDHYRLWTEKTFSVRHPVADPTALWPRMSDAIHPGAQGHLAFYRELAPLFDLPAHLPWEEC